MRGTSHNLSVCWTSPGVVWRERSGKRGCIGNIFFGQCLSGEATGISRLLKQALFVAIAATKNRELAIFVLFYPYFRQAQSFLSTKSGGKPCLGERAGVSAGVTSHFPGKSSTKPSKNSRSSKSYTSYRPSTFYRPFRFRIFRVGQSKILARPCLRPMNHDPTLVKRRENQTHS